MLQVDQISIKKTTWDPGSIFGSIFDGFWGRFWVILAPKIDQKSMLKFDRFSDAFWEGLWAAKADFREFDSIVSDSLGPPGESPLLLWDNICGCGTGPPPAQRAILADMRFMS